MNMKNRIAAALASATLCAPAFAMAEVPPTLAHNGYLTDSAQQPVSAALPFTFNIYTSESGADLVWGENIPGVQVTSGFYAVVLGLSNSLKDVFNTRKDVWLEVVVDGEKITPRQKITAVPYALVAGDAVGDIHPASVTVNGTKIIDEGGKWTGAVAAVKSVTAAAPLTGGAITDTGTIGIGKASSSADGYLAKEDFATFSAGTSYTAGPGVNLASNTISLKNSAFQCASANEALKSINIDTGAVTCEVDDNAAYSAGPGLALTGTVFSLPMTCGTNKIMVFDGASWICADYAPATGGVQSVGAAAPLLSSAGNNPVVSLSGIVPVANGGTGTGTAFGQGAVVYAGASGVYTSDASNLFWDGTNSRLGIGTSTPQVALHVSGGQVRASSVSVADGTAGSPSYRFESDPDSGLFAAGTNAVGITAGGTERARVDSTGLTVTGALKGVTNNYAENDGSVPNTSDVSYVNATSVSLAAGDYMLFASVEAACSGCFCQTRVYNSTDSIALGGDVHMVDLYGTKSLYAPASWVKKVSLAATKTIAVQQKIESGGAGTCYTRNARIFALRVGP